MPSYTSTDVCSTFFASLLSCGFNWYFPDGQSCGALSQVLVSYHRSFPILYPVVFLLLSFRGVLYILHVRTGQVCFLDIFLPISDLPIHFHNCVSLLYFSNI
jgi:hypothetical protein